MSLSFIKARKVQIILAFLSYLTINSVIADEASINGEASYLEDLVLPPHAVFKVSLEDVSLMDVPSTEIAGATVSPAGQVPIAFEIKYDKDDIQKGHRYSVRGKIIVDDKLLYITDTSNPVLDGKGDNNTKIMMKQVSHSPTDKQRSKGIFNHFPIHFLGLLPGANCESQYQLDLFSDHIYFIRVKCPKNGKSVASDDIGRWHIDTEKQQLVLSGGREQALLFSIIDSATIEKLDISGNKIESDLNYRLEASNTARTIEPKILMIGMYQYMADAALFKECITGLKMPVLFEKDNLALEQAYNADKMSAGALLKVHVEGRVVQRPKIDGEGMQAQLLVERFIKTMPNEHCGNQYVDASFSDTYWKLTALNGDPVKAKTNNREAHIIFRSLQNGNGEYRGATGCNGIFGNYQSGEKNISVSQNQLVMNDTICQDSDIEQNFLIALYDSVYWRIKGDHMELLNSTSQVLARFEAIYF